MPRQRETKRRERQREALSNVVTNCNLPLQAGSDFLLEQRSRWQAASFSLQAFSKQVGPLWILSYKINGLLHHNLLQECTLTTGSVPSFRARDFYELACMLMGGWHTSCYRYDWSRNGLEVALRISWRQWWKTKAARRGKWITQGHRCDLKLPVLDPWK